MMPLFPIDTAPRRRLAFTLIELLVSVVVLAFLILLVAQLVNSTTNVTISSNKHMDADGQARLLLDRLAMDFALMLKRGDVDYLLKQPGNLQAGNDQIAFFSEVPGYSSGTPSPVSLVAYRVNTEVQVERLGKGLLWNGASAAEYPLVFLPQTIAATWPDAIDPNKTDSDYEKIGPQVFRFEYCYLLKSGAYSITPWDAAAGSTAINGLQDVAAIAVAIAVIDPKSRGIVTNDGINSLIGQMEDFPDATAPGEVAAQWQSAINASSLPRQAAAAIRVYYRLFYLATTTQ